MESFLLVLCWGAGLVLVLGVAVYLLFDLPNLFENRDRGAWTIGYGFVDSLDEIQGVIGKHFIKDGLADDPFFRLLADPFIFMANDGMYLFTEHYYDKKGNLSVFFSKNIEQPSFDYVGPVLNESFHLSYPQVFRIGNEIFMLPETQASGKVILYKSTNFPLEWTPYREILPLGDVKDPSIYIKDNKIYMFGCQNNRLYCWVSDSVDAAFVKLEQAFIWGAESRPGGRIVTYNNKVLLPMQNSKNGYGSGLSLYEIYFNRQGQIQTKLYKRLFLKPRSDVHEFSHGMHHFDMVKLNNRYFVVFDGVPKLSNRMRLNYRRFLELVPLDIKSQIKNQWFK